MNSLNKLERTRRLALYGIFTFALLLFASFLTRVIYFLWHVHQSFPYENVFLIADLALMAAILIFASWRWLALKAFIKSNPSVRNRPKDERERYAWLKAYRPAFFVLLIVPVLGKILMLIYRAPYEVPYPSQLSLSAALMIVVGAFLYYSRELRHE
jgi:ABC-type Fe3+ transport system permease subunit